MEISKQVAMNIVTEINGIIGEDINIMILSVATKNEQGREDIASIDKAEEYLMRHRSLLQPMV